jgi:DNA-binding beta-propeller fold protein YncE
VSFDAADPSQFVQSYGTAALGQIYGGDFVSDDFTRIYMYNSAADSDFTFATYDPTSREYTVIAADPQVSAPQGWDKPPYPRWAGMAWDPATRTLYASTTGGQFCSAGNASDLYTVDPATGRGTRVGAIDTGSPLCIADIAVAPDGAMYGVDTIGNALVAIDKTTGKAAYVGSLGFDLINNGPHSLDFDDATGTLYLAAGHLYNLGGGGMFAIDLATGAPWRIGSFPIEPISSYGYFSMYAMSIATTGGECADPSQVPWLSLNQVGGLLTPGSHTPVELRLDAAGLAPGDYRAQLCAFSNDRSRALVRIPVSLTVGETNDRIFADGFQSP